MNDSSILSSNDAMNEVISQDNHYDVIIAGGGPVGAAMALTLAATLAANEARILLLDPQAWPSLPAVDALPDYDLRVYAIAPDVQAFLTDLGVWQDIAARRLSPYRAMEVWERGDVDVLHFSAEDLGRCELGHIVEHHMLLGALATAVRQKPQVVLAQDSVTALEQQAQAVSVQTANGQTYSASLLIAADGANSVVRQAAGINALQWRYEQDALVAMLETEQSHQATAWQRFLPTGPLALLPLANGASSLVWSCTKSLAAELSELSDAAFIERLQAASDARLGRIVGCSKRLSFPLRALHAERYVAGRCVLIGDAAHAVHPLAGQGVNLGLRDVQELAQQIGAKLSQGHDPGAPLPLKRYARIRKTANLQMLAVTDGLYRLYGAEAGPVPGMRRLGMRLTGRIGPIKQQLMRAAIGR